MFREMIMRYNLFSVLINEDAKSPSIRGVASQSEDGVFGKTSSSVSRCFRLSVYIGFMLFQLEVSHEQALV